MSVKALLRQLPDSIRVGPYDIALRVVPPSGMGNRENAGEFTADGLALEIRVKDEAPSAVHVVDTVLHEIGHAIFWTYLLNDADQEERTVATFGTAWTQVYRDNPGLLGWIAKGVA